MKITHVQHVSGFGYIWDVIDDLGDEWEVKSKTSEADSHFLPKCEYAEYRKENDQQEKFVQALEHAPKRPICTVSVKP